MLKKTITAVLILFAVATFLYSAIVPLKGFDVAMGVIIGLSLGWVIGSIAGYQSQGQKGD